MLCELYNLANARAEDVKQRMMDGGNTDEERKDIELSCHSRIMSRSTEGDGHERIRENLGVLIGRCLIQDDLSIVQGR